MGKVDPKNVKITVHSSERDETSLSSMSKHSHDTLSVSLECFDMLYKLDLSPSEEGTVILTLFGFTFPIDDSYLFLLLEFSVESDSVSLPIRRSSDLSTQEESMDAKLHALLPVLFLRLYC